MIVVDTSAWLAILRCEDDADIFIEALLKADGVALSAFNIYEARVVAFRHGGAAELTLLNELFSSFKAESFPFDEQQATGALDAYMRFGKGQHPAKLNLADWAAYALAKSLDCPLLFKGNDFATSDIVCAVNKGATP